MAWRSGREMESEEKWGNGTVTEDEEGEMVKLESVVFHFRFLFFRHHIQCMAGPDNSRNPVIF